MAKRLSSIDVLRGLDVLLMLFVNQLSELASTPHFLHHEEATVDGMTVTDVVFPAFLFIVGMAIPLALGARLGRGESRARVFRHVVTRTFALLILGLLEVNVEAAGPGDLGRAAVWFLLSTVAAVIVWGVGSGKSVGGDSSEASSSRRRILRRIAIAALIALAFFYRNAKVGGLVQIRPYWWGILGLIGWAYLVASSVYLLAKGNKAVLVGAIALLYSLYLADEAGAVGALFPLEPYVPLGGVLGSHSALVLSGALLTLMLLSRQQSPPGRAFAPALGYAAALALGGLLLHALHSLHSAFWISKVKATPAWCLLSAAFTTAAWAIVHYLIEVRGWRRWPKAVTMAGENALLIYVLQPLMLGASAGSLSLLSRSGTSGSPFWLSALLSLAFAWGFVRLCGWLRGRGVHMRI